MFYWANPNFGNGFAGIRRVSPAYMVEYLRQSMQSCGENPLKLNSDMLLEHIARKVFLQYIVLAHFWHCIELQLFRTMW